MDKIARTTALISGIVDVYGTETFQTELSDVLGKLIKRFTLILSKHAEQYELTTSNSVRDIKYYSVLGRIKEADSFHEKMIRGNLINSFLKAHRFTSKAEISRSRKRVQTIIKNISEDIIGVKILTELEEDCKNVISILRDKHSSLFSDKRDIYLDPQDLENQPIKMRNGLEFYKIRGIFKETFKFELQIKSKLLSVWGDMDHSMFYKDYSVSPLRDNVKESMVNLGRLIFQVDKFLLQIRNAEQNFSKNREVIDFIDKFSEQYSQLLKKKLRFGYRLEDISEFLFYLYKNLPKRKQAIRARLNYSILSKRGTNDLVKHYAKVRNGDFNLQIIELVYFNWYSRYEVDQAIDEGDFNRKIGILIGKYLEFLSTHLESDFTQSTQYLKSNFPKVCAYLDSGILLYSFDKINSFFSSLSTIIKYSDIEEGKYSDDQIDDIRNFILLLHYQENAEGYLKAKRDNINLGDLIATLTAIRFTLEGRTGGEIRAMSAAQDLIQRGLFILKKMTDEISN
jgi:ppGpp synthetase/RelA/SpoT-type nucleotidyltranferase